MHLRQVRKVEAMSEELKPVAWMYDVDGWSHREARMNRKNPLPDGWHEIPLYTITAIEPMIRDQVEREIVAYLDQLDAERRETNLLAWAARKIEAGEHRP